MMMRWFWRIYIPMAIVLLGSVALGPFGPNIEARMAPVRGPQSIAAIERTAHRLCWDWAFTKLRFVGSNNEDGFLDINGEPSGVAAPWEMVSGLPWGVAKLAVAPRTEPYTFRYCVDLPPAVKPSDLVRIRQTAFYPGFLGLWRLAVPFPDVVSEGAAAS